MWGDSMYKFFQMMKEKGIFLEKEKEFVLKSGKKSRFFYNWGKCNSGKALMVTGDAVLDEMASRPEFQQFDLLFTSAYKGILLASAVVCQIAFFTHRNIPVGYLRKERKDHGDGGDVVGAMPTPDSKVILFDDVLTTGGSLIEMRDQVQQLGGKVLCAVVITDRMDPDEKVSLEERLGVPIYSVHTHQQYLDARNK